jgi:hypothetical protein
MPARFITLTWNYVNMKLTLQYTNSIDKENIKEAVMLKDGEEAEKKGWKFLGSGVYKDAYLKGNIVVKFGKSLEYRPNHMLNEVNKYQKSDKNTKRYLARIFGGDNKKIIQKLVKLHKDPRLSPRQNATMVEVARKLNIGDYAPGANVVKSVDNKIVFYDFAGHTP